MPDTNADTLKRSFLALKDMRSKLDAFEHATREPIAIVGIGCRFPGGADNPEAFWNLLESGVDAVRQLPSSRRDSRWDVSPDVAGDPDSAAKKAAQFGGFLENVDGFDPQFFGIAPREAAEMDPQQRLLLEVTWEALENAGIAPASLSGSRTGVFVGITTNDYLQFALGDNRSLDAYSLTGTFGNFAAGRLSYILGLQGPCFAVDAACASSLVTVHVACQSLRAKECDVAITGGVNLIVDPWISIVLSRISALAPDGRCKTFDASANGLGRGEGCGMVVLKRASDAVRDGDNIVALIRGSAVSQDGRSSGLTVPNPKAQEDLIRAALANAGAEPGDITFLEAHGTGTPLGDPIEIEALGNIFRNAKSAGQPISIGSVKTNLGHLESAAGIAGLIKVALSLQRKKIPPHLHFKTPNPRLDWTRLPFAIPTALESWNAPAKRLAGVSSFGLSGMIAHAIVEEAEGVERLPAGLDRSAHVLTLSAPSAEGLQALAERYERFLNEQRPESLADICFTANTGRSHFRHRLAVVGDSLETLSKNLKLPLSERLSGEPASGFFSGNTDSGKRPKIAFLFTGQGSLYAGAGRSLYETQPTFRNTLQRCEELLLPHLEQPLLRVLYGDDSARLEDAAYAQAGLFSIEFALAELWKSWGVEPTAVMGHSLGEYVAACVAGIVGLEDALRLTAERGRLMRSLPGSGKMAAVFASESRVARAIAATPAVSIAAINGPENVVISGERDAVEQILRSLTAESIAFQDLQVTHAFHSPMIEPMMDSFAHAAAAVRFHSPRIPMVCNVTGKLASEELPLEADYWKRHLRAPVQFQEGMRTLAGLGCDLFLEIGPQPALTTLGRKCLPDGDNLWSPSLRRNRSDWQQILDSVASLYVRGVNLNWSGFDRDYARRKMPGPTYPFQRQRYWIDRRPESGASIARQAHHKQTSRHPLLGARIQSPAIQGGLFESKLRANAPDFLADHRILQSTVFPATGFLELAHAGATEMFGDGVFQIGNVVLHEALILESETERTVQLLVKKDGAAAAFEIFSSPSNACDEDSWTLHVTGAIKIESSRPAPVSNPDIDRSRLQDDGSEISIEAFYKDLWNTGLEYGAGFRMIEKLWVKDDEALGRIQISSSQIDAAGATEYAIHPALLDCCFQVLAGIREDIRSGIHGVYLPVAIDSLIVYRRSPSRVWCRGRLHPASEADNSASIGDLFIYDDSGETIAEVRGLQLRRVTRERFEQIAQGRPSGAVDTGRLLYTTEWRAQTAKTKIHTATSADDRSSLVISDVVAPARGGVKAALSQLLRSRGIPAKVAAPGEALASVAEFQNVLYLSGLHDPDAFDNFSVDDLDAFEKRACGGLLELAQSLIQKGGSTPRLWVVTRNGQRVADRDSVAVKQAPLWGLSRVLHLEHPELRITTLDVSEADAARCAEEILQAMQDEEPEDQIAIRDGSRYIARLTPWTNNGTPTHENQQLDIPNRGVFDNLTLLPATRRRPGPGEVEIQVHAAGLNFRDVLNALGMYPGGPIPLGGECAGIVVETGAGVQNFKPGDAVIALASRAFCNFVTIPAAWVAHKPEPLSFEQATTIPVTFVTAYYSLHNIARMKAGDRVLIHAGAGGVGMAAIQLALQAGAEVFATAGNEEKRAVVRSMGVRRVMNSRSTDFAGEILSLTNGEGVDIILNSLTGEFISKGLEILRPGGRFVEIGKVELWDQDRVTRINPRVSYTAVAVDRVMDQEPAIISNVLEKLMAGFERGDLKALPYSSFPLNDAAQAFRHMAQAKHIGKIVLSVLSPNKQERTARIDPDGTYLITGGAGGLGLLLARWLSEKGARHLALMGRSAPSTDAQASIRELEESGVHIAALQGDVSDETSLNQTLTQLSQVFPPLRGVFHLAGVLDDGVLAQQSWSRFASVFAPKVRGAWLLHQRTRSMDLDLFVMFSSASSVLGTLGQSNYAAANAFLDALAHRRRAEGLPGLSINWGPWEESGMAANLAQDSRGTRSWREQGFAPMKSSQALAALEAALESRTGQMAILPIEWKQFLRRYHGKAPGLFNDLHNGASPAARSNNATEPDLLQRLQRSSPEISRKIVKEFVREQALKVLGLRSSETINLLQPLNELGMDSMMAVELRNALGAGIKRTLSAGILYFHPSVEALAAHLAAELGFGETSSAQEPSTSLLDEIEQLSEAELDARLAEIAGQFDGTGVPTPGSE